MSRAPSITAATLDAARAVMAPPRSLALREAARELGVSKSSLARALGGANLAAPPLAPPQEFVPAPKGRQAVPPVARTPSGPRPTVLAEDSAVELLILAGEMRKRMSELNDPGSKEYRDLATLIRTLLRDAEAMKAKRPQKPTADEREEAQRPRAEEVLGKVRSGVRAWAQRDAETRRCCRCGQQLSPEIVMQRKVEAGLVDAA